MIENEPLVPLVLPLETRWAFTRYGLERLRHHMHFIPVSRGISLRFMREHWPGLTMGWATRSAVDAGAFVDDPRHFSGLRVAEGVVEFHIRRDGTTKVVDRSVTSG